MVAYCKIYDLVKQVPLGYVTTYGRIARQLNCGARQVGYALAAAPHDGGIPWHRIINSEGRVSRRKQGGRDQLQQKLLVAEGVIFDRIGRVDLDRYGWHGRGWEPQHL